MLFYRKEGDSNPRILKKGLTVFETARFDHSRIFPMKNAIRLKNLYVARLTRFERATSTSAGWRSNPAEL